MNNMVMIDDADEHVLEPQGWRTTVVNLDVSINAKGPLITLDVDEHLYIKWPGFVPTTHKNPVHARIDTYRNGHPITRLQFAQEICCLFSDFHRRCCVSIPILFVLFLFFISLCIFFLINYPRRVIETSSCPWLREVEHEP